MAITTKLSKPSYTSEKLALAQTDPTVVGSWHVAPNNCPINPVHGALMHTGQVVFIAGSGNLPSNANATDGTAVWDYQTGNFVSRPVAPVDSSGKPYDFFCMGQAFLSDGTLLCAGGTLRYDPFRGLSNAFIFSPSTQKWTVVQSMAHGRWYPTLITMGNGQVLTVAGLDENGNNNVIPEVYNPTTGKWTAYLKTDLPMYANLILLSDGRIFYSGIQFAYGRTIRTLLLPTDPTQKITETLLAGTNGGMEVYYATNQGTTVLLPPAQNQRVMVLGGGDLRSSVNGSPNPNSGVGTNRVNIVDFTSSKPTYTTAAYLEYGRIHIAAVILPDRTVFVCNGSGKSEVVTQSMLPGEIYNPATNTWTTVATPSVAGRVYHAGALLLPDGTVAAFGGNPQRGTYEAAIEIYSPPYLFKGTRPVITSAPQTWHYGATVDIKIQTVSGQTIQWASLIKPTATTHSCDTEQRLVDLPISSTTSTSTDLKVTVTNNPNLAPPGWYMLFITDTNGIPSVAAWVQLLPS